MTPSEANDLSQRARVLAGGGEMGELMRAYDWSRSAVGPVEDWPQSLRTAVSIELASGYPMLVVWGPRFVQFYNDAYRPVLGAKHPAALGQTTPECWSEIWESMLSPMFHQVVESGVELSARDLMFPLVRHGFTEECYFDFSYSPIRDESYSVGGILVTCSETTGRVIGERRLKALRELADAAARASTSTAVDACLYAADVLRLNGADVPFALIYLLNQDGTLATLGATAGLEAGAPGALSAISLTGQSRESAWPVDQVIASGTPLLVEAVPSEFGPLPGGPWPEPARSALLLPIAHAGQERPNGVLVAGLSPRLAVDAEYRSFIGLVAGQIATALSSARAHEEERRRAEALAELDRAKTTFFSNVSHEFRTPLSLLLGPLEDTLSDTTTSLPQQHRERLEMARRNGLRLLRLVNALLDFSRIEAGRVEAVYEPSDLSNATRELASSFRSAVERAGLRFVVECEHPVRPVFVDRQMWEKIVLNLLSNAFKFTLDGEIVVSIRDGGDAAELVVRDTGVGIPEQELPRLFERFHRVQGTRARTQEGTGIGLALVHELVRLHDGNISVASTPGAGTTVTVRLPFGSAHLPAERVEGGRVLASTSTGAAPFVQEALRWIPDSEAEGPGARSTPPSVAQPHGAPADSARILIADDNVDMRDYLYRLLGDAHRVECVATGTLALQRALEEPPDLVLTDVMMPGLDGFQLLTALRNDASTRLIPVILLSARAGEEAKVEALDEGADDYLVKPFTARELTARVRANLELSHLRREAVRLERGARQHAESERERLRELFEQAPAIMCILSGPEHVVILANTRYIQVIGNRQILDKPIREAMPEIEGQGYVELLDAVYATGEPVVGRESRVLLARGPGGSLEEAFFDYIYAPVRDALGNIQGVFISGYEVTELVQARKRFEAIAAENARLYLESQRTSRELDLQRRIFLSTAAHDLRTPIAAVRATAQLAHRHLQRDGGVADADRLLGRIEASTQKMASLIDELLDITQSETANGLVLSRSAVDLAEIAQRVLDEYRPLTSDHALLLVQETETVIGHWDATRLERVVGNLVSNAIKYSPKGGEIVVSIDEAYEDGHAVATLSVRDQGVGIRPNELDRVFHRFERGSNVTDIPGNGIGLAYAKDIAVQHGGTISVSSAPGEGSTFTLRLPLTSF